MPETEVDRFAGIDVSARELSVARRRGKARTSTAVEAQAKGKVKGQGVLQLSLTHVTVSGQSYPVKTSVWSQTQKGKGERTAATTGSRVGGRVGSVGASEPETIKRESQKGAMLRR